jgi:hypothetical protein
MRDRYWGRVFCPLIELDDSMLACWMRHAHVEPIARGGVGRGHNHAFSGRQVLALLVAGVLKRTVRGMRDRYVKTMMTEFELMTDEDVRNFINGQGACCEGPDEYLAGTFGEEVIATKEPDQDSYKVSEEVARLLAKVGPMILAGLEPEIELGDGKGIKAKDRAEAIEMASKVNE